MESVHADPNSYGWTNVLYSYHEYDMMGSDLGSNQQTYQSEVQAYIDQSNAWNIPSYVGEFMVTGDTATWMLGQMNSAGIWYTGWTYATVDQGDWGLFNFPASTHVDVSSDSYATILSTWSNMGSKSQQNIANIYRSAVARRSFSDREVRAPVYMRRSQGQEHGGRSRGARGPIRQARWLAT
jgi:endoglucanase